MRLGVFIFLFLSSFARAETYSCTPAQPKGNQPNTFRLHRFTNYTPRGGRSRGRDATGGYCHTLASGFNPCDYYLEDQQKGYRPFTVAAVPQKGEAARLYGGVYRADALQGVADGGKGCTLLMAGDYYASAAEARRYGVLNSDGMKKMDVVTQYPHGALANRVNRAGGGRLTLVGTSDRFRNKYKPRGSQRWIDRLLDAIASLPIP